MFLSLFVSKTSYSHILLYLFAYARTEVVLYRYILLEFCDSIGEVSVCPVPNKIFIQIRILLIWIPLRI
jgi:hypothetical protein